MGMLDMRAVKKEWVGYGDSEIWEGNREVIYVQLK